MIIMWQRFPTLFLRVFYLCRLSASLRLVLCLCPFYVAITRLVHDDALAAIYFNLQYFSTFMGRLASVSLLRSFDSSVVTFHGCLTLSLFVKYFILASLRISAVTKWT